MKDKLKELLRPIVKEILAEIKNGQPRLVGTKIDKPLIKEADTSVILQKIGKWNIKKYKNRAGKWSISVDNGNDVMDYPIYYNHNGKIAYDYPERIPSQIKSKIEKLYPTLNETKIPIKEAVKGVNLEQPHSNLYIKGWGRDKNGNTVILVGFPNDKGWAIQTNGTLPETDWTIKRAHKELSDDELNAIGQEVTDYVSQYGSKEQKARLKRYNRQ